MTEIIDPSRRDILKYGLITTGLVFAKPSLVMAAPRPKMKELSFYNLHTDEKLRVTYFKNGSYNRSALAEIHHILRDFRTGDVFPIATNLIDLLHDLQGTLKTDTTIQVISGYRSQKTNSMLAKKSKGGVAKKSYHTRGLATDIRMPGVSLRQLKTTALFMKRGGVGYYPKSNFVHVDVGPVRRWNGA